MIRFGNGYISCETPQGEFITGIGQPPMIIPEELRVKLRVDESDKPRPGRNIKPIIPNLNFEEISKKSKKIDYVFLKSNYISKWKPQNLSKLWKEAKSIHSPCDLDYFYADGIATRPNYAQIKKNVHPNNTNHSSGCGPTAWMMLLGWHDLAWTPNLLKGEHSTNDTFIENQTMAIHDYLGTINLFGEGFTWPNDMAKGYSYVRRKLGHSCGYWYKTDYDWLQGCDTTKVFKVARWAIREKRPFIVGYYDDWHYTIGYIVAECKNHGWEDHSWIYICEAPTDDGGWGEKWISKHAIFAIYAVSNFYFNAIPTNLIKFNDGVITTFDHGGIYLSPNGTDLGASGGTQRVYMGSRKPTAMTQYKDGVLTAFDRFVNYAPYTIHNSPNGDYLGGGGNTTIVYTGNEKALAMIQFHEAVLTAFRNGTIYYSPDGNNLGGGGNSGPLYNRRIGRAILAMTQYKQGLLTAFFDTTDIFHPTCKIFYSPDGNNPGGNGTTIQVYNGTKFVTAMTQYKDGVLTAFSNGQIYFSPHGRFLGGGGEGTIRVYNNPMYRALAIVPHNEGILILMNFNVPFSNGIEINHVVFSPTENINEENWTLIYP